MRTTFFTPFAFSAYALVGGAVLCQDVSQVEIVPRLRHAIRSPVASVRLNVNMVMIPANVTDQRDRPILDLTKEDFHVFEDAVEQRIESFSIEDAPVSLGIVFDTSGSMRNKINNSVKAIEQCTKTSAPGDEFFLVRFADEPELLV